MTFQQWYLGLDPLRRAAVLAHRPDVAALPDADEADRADALASPRSVHLLARDLSLPQLQVLEALLALGRRATVPLLCGLLTATSSDHEAQVATVLDELYDRGLAWPDAESRADGVAAVPAAAVLFPHPLGADGTLADLLSTVEVADLRQMVAAHGRPQSVDPRHELETALVDELSDAERVRAAVVAAGPEVCEPILAYAKGPATEAEAGDYAGERGFDYDTGYLGRGWGRPPTRREIFQQHPAALKWARSRGIVLPAPRRSHGYAYDYPEDVRMAVEVSVALRGSGFRADFTPVRPEPVTGFVDDDAVASAASVAVADFAQQALAVLDVLARGPWPMTKSGGLGLRELERLAKASVVGPGTARLVLELAQHAGLLHQERGGLVTADAFRGWRSAAPAERYAALVAAWWHLPFPPTAASVGSRGSVRPLERSALCDPADRARETLIHALSALEQGAVTDLGALERFSRWHRPTAPSLAHDRASLPSEGWDVAWAEAETLGVIALGALTPVGRALHAGTAADELVPLLTALVPRDTDRVALGSDLTAVAIGAPTDDVRLLLDRMADRDSSGLVVTWRFSPTSVRRALDEGAAAAALVERLEQVAGCPLPQPLRYLFDDVARRHGELRLSLHGTLVRGLEPSRVGEALVDRSLESLRLRRLAPTILSSRASVEDTLTALRRAGYFPVPEGEPAEWLEIDDLRSSA